MTFTGFTPTDFETFHIAGLEPRMQAIRERIQPKFHAIAAEILDDVAMLVGQEMFLHVAKHARRKVNAPADTWMSFCHNKKGYKQHPHFQIGLYDDRVFIWFALIYEAPNKRDIATKLLKNKKDILKQIPSDYLLSTDHMKKEATTFHDMTTKDFTASLERFRDVKVAELLIGRYFPSNDDVLQNGEQFLKEARNTIEKLVPLYQLSI
jgi:uncharacterized protein YktB (UPF0637 family)